VEVQQAIQAMLDIDERRNRHGKAMTHFARKWSSTLRISRLGGSRRL